MPHSNASIVLDMDMLARVFNLNLFYAYENVFGAAVVGSGGGPPLGNSIIIILSPECTLAHE